jgi:adenylate kinase
VSESTIERGPELILLAGPPGSGKSSIGKKFIELGTPSGARHLSIGDLKRAITAGEAPSKYADVLQSKEYPGRKSGAAPSEAMIGIMEEFIVSQPGMLTLIDGFPRYMDRIVPFRESVKRIGASVLALCVVEVDEEILVQRLSSRQSRSGQKIQDPMERLVDHNEHIVPTLETLAQEYPTYRLDGELPIEANARVLQTIYADHTNCT